MSIKFVGKVVGDSQTEVNRERYTVVLTFSCDDVAPLVGAIDAGSAIRICGLVSGKLKRFRVQPTKAIDPREGAYEVSAQGRHFRL